MQTKTKEANLAYAKAVADRQKAKDDWQKARAASQEAKNAFLKAEAAEKAAWNKERIALAEIAQEKKGRDNGN